MGVSRGESFRAKCVSKTDLTAQGLGHLRRPTLVERHAFLCHMVFLGIFEC